MSDAHDDHGIAHVMPARTLVAVWAALIALTGITVWTASMSLHPFDLVIAIVIATTKALLVALYFMHLKYDRPFNGLIFMLSFVFAGLFVIFSMFDTARNQAEIMARTEVEPIKEAWREMVAEEAAHSDQIEALLSGEHGHGADGHGDGAHGDEAQGDGTQGDGTQGEGGQDGASQGGADTASEG